MPASALPVFANPASYVWSADMPHEGNNKGRLDSASLDLEYKFDDGFFRSVKIGGRWAERTERDFDNGYNWTALGRGWNGFGAVQAGLEQELAASLVQQVFGSRQQGRFDAVELLERLELLHRCIELGPTNGVPGCFELLGRQLRHRLLRGDGSRRHPGRGRGLGGI